MKLMMIEDDKTIVLAVKTFLTRHGFEIDTFNSLGATAEANLSDYNLLILDVNLPDGSGFDYLRWLRETCDILVIMLTVKGSEEYVLKGFSQGADDYITKPFSLAILKARIDNIIGRRTNREEKIVFRELLLDISSKTAKIGDRNLDIN